MQLLLLGTQYDAFHSYKNTSNIYVLRIHNQQFMWMACMWPVKLLNVYHPTAAWIE